VDINSQKGEYAQCAEGAKILHALEVPEEVVKKIELARNMAKGNLKQDK
jgi:hypothetical protein